MRCRLDRSFGSHGVDQLYRVLIRYEVPKPKYDGRTVIQSLQCVLVVYPSGDHDCGRQVVVGTGECMHERVK